MKKKGFLCLLLVLALVMGACSHGNVTCVRKEFGNSEQYSKWEIGQAMKVVTRCFYREFDGCTLTELRYDETATGKAAARWAEQYQADTAIVLVSTFRVGSSGGDGSLNPDSVYRNWQWVLTRNGLGAWKLQTWGYG